MDGVPSSPTTSLLKMCAASRAPSPATSTGTRIPPEEFWSPTIRASVRGASPRSAAEQLADSGLRVHLANDYTPTPALSYAVKRMGAAGGVMITSSHNPWNWNGVKFKASYGGSATSQIMQQIEGYLDAPAVRGEGGRVCEMDFKAPYVAAIEKFADMGLISKAGFRFAIDVMYGAGRGVLAGIFARAGVPHLEIRGEVNPLFPGINPEPILPHVKALQDTVVREKCSAGLVVDGDADRLGAVAEDGSFVDSHKCFALLLEWLLKRKQWPGAVTRAFNTTGMLDRIARKYNRELIEHGIGFKYVCDIVLSGREVLIGGEESGGIGIPRHLPERDGILNCLLLANIMAEEGKLARTTGGATAKRVWPALLRPPRSAHCRRVEAFRPSPRRRMPAEDRLQGAAHGEHGRLQVLPRRPPRRATGPSHGCCCAVPEPSRCCASTAKPPALNWWTRFFRPPSRSSMARQSR